MISETIKVNMGVKQGYILSPLLFNLVLDAVLRKSNIEERDIRWKLTNRLEDLDYADNSCLLSQI